LRKDKQIARCEAEKEVYGATHADLGAYLLGLWGLPVGIVEAVALHHEPYKAIQREFSPLAAVHLANTFEHQQSSGPETAQVLAPLDMQYVEEVGIADQIADWQNELAPQPELAEAA
jgi:HD-like signal output (HDOD) protein